jgi:hypothetical protein
MRRKIRQYLPALLLYLQRRVEGGRGAVVAVRTRDIYGVDRRCCVAVQWLMMRLVERGFATPPLSASLFTTSKLLTMLIVAVGATAEIIFTSSRVSSNSLFYKLLNHRRSPSSWYLPQ